MNTNDLVKWYKNNKLADIILIPTKLERNGIAVIQMVPHILKSRPHK